MNACAPQLLSPRAVPLGGIRALPVRRTLPQRGRSLIGAWCFIDHYGPTELSADQGMAVPRHPHVGLQTVSWLFEGAIDHTDSAGNAKRVEPGTLALMTAGSGITHSEFSTPDSPVLHGVQLWIALPDQCRGTEHHFEQYRPRVLTGPGWSARVAIGSLLGSASPVTTYSETVLAEIILAPHTMLALDARSGISKHFEYGILIDQGDAQINDVAFHASQLAFLPVGNDTVQLKSGERGARIMFLGGTPLNEKIIMWWNFVARTHEEIVAAHASYSAAISTPAHALAGGQFGPFPAGTSAALNPPTLPTARLLPRS